VVVLVVLVLVHISVVLQSRHPTGSVSGFCFRFFAASLLPFAAFSNGTSFEERFRMLNIAQSAVKDIIK